MELLTQESELSLSDGTAIGSKSQTPSSSAWYASPFRNESPYFFFFFCFFRALPAAHGGSQARNWIRAVAAGLYYSHSNTGCELCLWPTPQLAQHRILNPLSEARDQIRIIMDTTQARYLWATMGTSWKTLLPRAASCHIPLCILEPHKQYYLWFSLHALSAGKLHSHLNVAKAQPWGSLGPLTHPARGNPSLFWSHHFLLIVPLTLPDFFLIFRPLDWYFFSYDFLLWLGILLYAFAYLHLP